MRNRHGHHRGVGIRCWRRRRVDRCLDHWIGVCVWDVLLALAAVASSLNAEKSNEADNDCDSCYASNGYPYYRAG